MHGAEHQCSGGSVAQQLVEEELCSLRRVSRIGEAALSFLGVGLPPEIPSWGNIMSEGRKYFQLYPGLIFIPGAFLAVTVLSVNLIGDALRDIVDPKMKTR